MELEKSCLLAGRLWAKSHSAKITSDLIMVNPLSFFMNESTELNLQSQTYSPPNECNNSYNIHAQYNFLIHIGWGML